jgi:hypothetical protein
MSQLILKWEDHPGLLTCAQLHHRVLIVEEGDRRVGQWDAIRERRPIISGFVGGGRGPKDRQLPPEARKVQGRQFSLGTCKKE